MNEHTKLIIRAKRAMLDGENGTSPMLILATIVNAAIQVLRAALFTRDKMSGLEKRKKAHHVMLGGLINTSHTRTAIDQTIEEATTMLREITVAMEPPAPSSRDRTLWFCEICGAVGMVKDGAPCDCPSNPIRAHCTCCHKPINAPTHPEGPLSLNELLTCNTCQIKARCRVLAPVPEI